MAAKRVIKRPGTSPQRPENQNPNADEPDDDEFEDDEPETDIPHVEETDGSRDRGDGDPRTRTGSNNGSPAEYPDGVEIQPDGTRGDELNGAANIPTDQHPNDPRSGTEPTEAQNALAQAEKDAPPPMTGRPRDGRTFRYGEKVIFKGVQRGGIVEVQENVYQGRVAPGSARWRYHLLMAKGSQVPGTKAKALPEGEYEVNGN